jgi:ComF family protein
VGIAPVNIIDYIRRRIDEALDVLYPPVCSLCRGVADSPDRLICRDCWETIAGFEEPYCFRCRQAVGEDVLCPLCRPAPMVVFSLGYYQGSLQTILHDLKFSALKPIADTLGARLAAMIESRLNRLRLDCIVPIPLHQSRMYIRGFNQSETIATAIGRRLDLPVYGDILYMTRRTRQQARLPAHRRADNVRGAYAVDDSSGLIAAKRVLLVDDITTTGATLRETARILRLAGAGKITVAVAATTL